MTQSDSSPTRSLPDNPNLGQLRKQAKELLKSYQRGEDTAVAEVERFELDPAPASFALADAQRVLARAYGYSSWTSLKIRVVGSNRKLFREAVAAGDVEAVGRIAKSRPGLVREEWWGELDEPSALHLAVMNRDVATTRLLMQYGADSRSRYWPSAHALASDREYGEIVAVIEQEEERRRKDLSSVGATIGSNTEEIKKAILDDRCSDAVRILETDPSLIGACSLEGASPLHFAAWAHSPTMVGWLLDRNASVDAGDAEGTTPLDYAAIVSGWSANDDFFCFLENASVEPTRFDETVQLLRSAGARLTPRAAVAMGDREAVLKMDAAGTLHNEVNYMRGGLLAIAVRVNRIEMVQLLLDLGLNPTEPATPKDGTPSSGSPLWCAAMCGRHDIAELLLAHGADVNASICACGDALGNAYTTRDEKMIALLRKHGARITVEQVGLHRDVQTAKAIVKGTMSAESLNIQEPTRTQLVEQLLWAAACGGDPEIVKMCLPLIQRDLNDPWWSTILAQPTRIWNHHSLHTNNDLDRSTYAECLRLILQHGVHPDGGSVNGSNQLHGLAMADQMTADERVIFARILLDAGASLQRRDPLLQSTPLGWACRCGHVELAKLYLDRGADALEAGAEPWATPLAWATKRKHHDIIVLLQQRTSR